MIVRRSRLFAAVAACSAAGLAFAPSAQADDGKHVTVRAGDSIQEAVDAAEPGTTIHVEEGVYRESVTIMTDGITLKGHDAIIAPGAQGQPTACDGDEGDAVSGICILGMFEGDAVSDRVSDVTVKGVTVWNASSHGLIGIGTEDLEVRDSRFLGNGGYGAASFDTMGTTFEDDISRNNVEAGFYVGDSPEADAKVEDNISTGNELGFFFRNASHGEAENNVAKGNCIGMLVLAGAPGPATDWELDGNRVRDNNKVCEPVEDIPPLSGAGIVMAGAQDFEVEDNRVTGNASEAESLAKGGIVVVTGPFAPGFAPSGEVEDNRVLDNAPADINWDGTGEVDFDDNECETSEPEGLCGDDEHDGV